MHLPWEPEKPWWEWAEETKGGMEWGEGRVEGMTEAKLIPSGRCYELKHSIGTDGQCLVCKARLRNGQTITAKYSER